MTQTGDTESGVREDLLCDQVSIFPVPSLDYFSTHFSDDVLALNYPVTDTGTDQPNKSANSTRFPSPPPVPGDESFDIFGIPVTRTDHVLRDLEQQNIQQLGIGITNRKILLRRLLWSAVAKFIELLDCVVKNPYSPVRTEAFEELQTVFINFHHTVNQYRQPQAEESFVELLTFQKDRNLKQASVLLDKMDEVLTVLNVDSDAATNGPSENGESLVFDKTESTQKSLDDVQREVRSIRQDLTALQSAEENGFIDPVQSA
ncbi:mediator of RNA polymerase II transcription subunit 7-like [Paramacrobiotus metropolitanus]|uniref:mediator of RNA polymerase II transcription subunit 7-like n=1 Tax=Paramacrobiotus metropolitanus TaxID=2943436 RepID=UPI002445F534|nr:mediator of RNA polymerase II transcription subunit 7-like [Paramacrobiotus metropolitanus]